MAIHLSIQRGTEVSGYGDKKRTKLFANASGGGEVIADFAEFSLGGESGGTDRAAPGTDGALSLRII